MSAWRAADIRRSQQRTANPLALFAGGRQIEEHAQIPASVHRRRILLRRGCGKEILWQRNWCDGPRLSLSHGEHSKGIDAIFGEETRKRVNRENALRILPGLRSTSAAPVLLAPTSWNVAVHGKADQMLGYQ